jgi:hypothetical protein
MPEDLLALVGLLSLLWIAVQRSIPGLAEWRSKELMAWSVASKETQKRLAEAWRVHWKIYREVRKDMGI